MTIHLTQASIWSRPATQARPARQAATRKRFHPRTEILDEVIAGFLWMSLDPPEDITISELNEIAHRLVTLIQTGKDAASIEKQVRLLQEELFGVHVDAATVRNVAERCRACVTAVRGAVRRAA